MTQQILFRETDTERSKPDALITQTDYGRESVFIRRLHPRFVLRAAGTGYRVLIKMKSKGNIFVCPQAPGAHCDAARTPRSAVEGGINAAAYWDEPFSEKDQKALREAVADLGTHAAVFMIEALRRREGDTRPAPAWADERWDATARKQIRGSYK